MVVETCVKLEQRDKASGIDAETLRIFKKKVAEKQHAGTILFLSSPKSKDSSVSAGINSGYHRK